MLTFVFITLLVLLALIITAGTKRKTFKNLPNGPNGMPIIGNILQLGRKPHLTLSKWADEFGHLYTIDLLGTPALVINDPKTMRDIFGNLNSTGKYSTPTICAVHGSNHGILNTEGGVWFEQHKFFMKVFRQFGFRGGNQLIPTILKECKDLCNWIDNELKDSNDGSLNLDETMLHSVTNIVWNAVTGEEHTTHLNKIVTLLAKVLERFNEASVLIFMPWLRFIVPEKSGWNNLVKVCTDFHEHVQKCFEERKIARKLNIVSSATGKVLDAYLDQVENCKEASSTFFGENGLKHGLCAVISLLLTASETTSSHIKWIVHYLLAHPDVQRKLQDEVDAAVREVKGNFVEIQKSRLPYLEAVVLEVLRITCLAPIGVLQKLLDDIVYDGYSLSKGTLLLANIYHAHMDTKVWKEPETFRPERFLKGSENERKRLKDCVVAFQEGRRKCPGEQFAKDMSFWYAFTLVEKFSFHKEGNRSLKDYLEPISGFMLLPPKLGIVVKRRNN